ncbi:MAG: hypothetical protein KDC99_18555 [Cyclobacteriaceae bacterium]|nr:hypothetical protein [Cyclobacteriaceae bacterium]
MRAYAITIVLTSFLGCVDKQDVFVVSNDSGSVVVSVDRENHVKTLSVLDYGKIIRFALGPDEVIAFVTQEMVHPIVIQKLHLSQGGTLKTFSIFPSRRSFRVSRSWNRLAFVEQNELGNLALVTYDLHQNLRTAISIADLDGEPSEVDWRTNENLLVNMTENGSVDRCYDVNIQTQKKQFLFQDSTIKDLIFDANRDQIFFASSNSLKRFDVRSGEMLAIALNAAFFDLFDYNSDDNLLLLREALANKQRLCLIDISNQSKLCIDSTEFSYVQAHFSRRDNKSISVVTSVNDTSKLSMFEVGGNKKEIVRSMGSIVFSRP